LLLKGHDEVLRANNPLEHLEMLLLRVIYAASMPDPGELAKLLEKGGVPTMPLAAPAAPRRRKAWRPSRSPQIEVPSAAGAEAPASALTVAQIHQLLESTRKSSACGRCLRSSANHRTRARQSRFRACWRARRLVRTRSGRRAARRDRQPLARAGRERVRGGRALAMIRAATLADNDARIRELPVVKAALAAFPDARLVEADDNRHRSNP
jgi:DNA polymerase-3 subunit gamma/tau